MEAKSSNFRLIFVILLIILSFIFGYSGGVLAAAPPIGLKISPLTFKFTLDPGQTQTATVSVSNTSDSEIKITSEVEDFILGDEKGTPQFLPRGSEKTFLAYWIEVLDEQFSLDPQETKDATFEIKVPKDAEAGGHYAAVFFKTEARQGEGQTEVGVSGRVGALVLVSVTGEVTKGGEIVEFKAPKFLNHGPVKFFLRFKNTGTVHYEPEAKVKIKGWLGKENEISLGTHVILPASIRQYEGEWNKKWLFGQYQATVEIPDGDGQIHTQTKVFWAFPWIYILIILGGIGVLVWVAKYLKKKYKIVGKD